MSTIHVFMKNGAKFPTGVIAAALMFGGTRALASPITLGAGGTMTLNNAVTTNAAFPLNTTVTTGTPGYSYQSATYNFHMDGADAVFDFTIAQNSWTPNGNWWDIENAGTPFNIPIIANEDLRYSVTGTVSLTANSSNSSDNGTEFESSVALGGGGHTYFNYGMSIDTYTNGTPVTFNIGDDLSSIRPVVWKAQYFYVGAATGTISAGQEADITYSLNTNNLGLTGSGVTTLEYRFSPLSTPVPLPSALPSGLCLLIAWVGRRMVVQRIGRK